VLPLAFALFPLSVGSVGRLAALVADRPGLSATAAAAELVTFWGLGAVLSSRYGAAGMAIAAGAGTTVYALVIVWRTRAVLPFALRGGTLAAVLALPVLPLLYFRGTLATNAGLLAVSLVVYAALLVWQRVITPDELRALQRAARMRGPVEAG
jgi:hypothetical protein